MFLWSEKTSIKFELLTKGIAEIVKLRLGDMNIDMNEIVQSKAVCALEEIKEIISDTELSDFDVVEKIVCVFEKYNIACGGRHDF